MLEVKKLELVFKKCIVNCDVIYSDFKGKQGRSRVGRHTDETTTYPTPTTRTSRDRRGVYNVLKFLFPARISS